MFVELIEALRCPRDHEESPLVATASRTDVRHILEGVLGCPVCRAEFPIRRGEAFFASDMDIGAIAPDPDSEMAMRLAAFLELTDARGFAILCGRWGAHAEAVRAVSDTPLLLVNPPAGIDVHATGIVRVRGRLPVASASARAAALEESDDSLLVASTIASVRPKGRVVGPATVPLPDHVHELTRDPLMWVGEKSAASDDPTRRLVTLQRA